MRRILVLAVCGVSCGGGGGGGDLEPCGPLGECPDGFQCNPVDMLCYRTSAGPDAGVADVPENAPQTTITSHPATAVASASAEFAFSSSAPGATFECRLDAGGWFPCTSPNTVVVDEGQHTFSVAAIAAAVKDPTPAEFTWTVDFTGPDTTVVGPPPATNQTSATFDLGASEAGSTFECDLDGQGFQPCIDGVVFSNLLDGTHTLVVRAIDALGNADPSPQSWTWRVDTVAPQTTLDAQPNDPTNSITAVFDFSSSEAASTFTCKLDTQAPEACDPGKSYSSLGEGSHTFTVYATDPAGNPDGSPEVYSWTIVLGTPDTILEQTPPASSNQLTATFVYSSTRLPATFECILDGGAPAACNSGTITYTDLAVGPHTFTVTAIDDAGNRDIDPAVWVWTIDLTPATTPTIATTPATTSVTPVNNNQPTVSGTADTGDTVSLYNAPGCTGTAVAQVVAAGGTYSFQTSVADDTATTFSARAVDEAGNPSSCSANVVYYEDSSAPGAPTVDIAPQTTPTDPANDNSPVLSGLAEDGATVALYGQASCGGSVQQSTTAAGTGGYAFTLSVADNSTTTWSVRATDRAGNPGPCSSAASYHEDSLAPTAATIATTPATTALDPENQNAITVSGGAETGATVRLYASAGCTGSPAQTTTAAASAYTFSVTVDDNSTTTFSADVVDAADNVSPCSSNVTYYEDSDAPTTPTIGTNPATTSTAPANNNTPSVLGNAESGATVSLYSGAACAGTALQTTTAASGAYSFSVTVGDNTTTTYSVRAVDAANNGSPCSGGVTYYEDSSGPTTPTVTTTPVTAAATPQNNNNPTVNGTAAAGSTVRRYTGGACAGTEVASTTAAGNGTYSFAVTVTDDSTTTFSVRAYDAAQNPSGCASVTYYEDSTAAATPSITGTNPAANTTTTPTQDRDPIVSLSVTGGGTNGGANRVRLFKTSNCTGMYKEASVTTTTVSLTADGNAQAGADGLTQYSAHALDYAGNTSTCSTAVNYYTDNTVPVLSLTGWPPIVDDNSGVFSFSATDNSPATISFTCTLDGSAASCASPQGYSYLYPGAHNFSVVATDFAGNSSTAASYGPWTVRVPPGHVAVIGHDMTAPPSSQVRDIFWNALRLASSKFSDKRAIRVAWWVGSTTSQERANVDTLLRSFPPGTVIKTFDTSGQLPSVLPGNDALVVSDQNLDPVTMQKNGADNGTVLRNYVSNGGVIIVLDGQTAAKPSGTAGLVVGAELMRLASYSVAQSSSTLITDATDPLVAGVTNYEMPASSTTYRTTDNRDEVVVGFHDFTVVLHKSFHLMEDFEQGIWVSPWKTWTGAAPGSVAAAFAHDGQLGLDSSAGFHYRDDVVTIQMGKRVSAWVKVPNATTGLHAALVAFGASGTETYSLQFHASFPAGAPPMGLLYLRRTVNSQLTEFGVSQSFTIVPNTWYKIEVEVTFVDPGKSFVALGRAFNSSYVEVGSVSSSQSMPLPAGNGTGVATAGQMPIDTIFLHDP